MTADEIRKAAEAEIRVAEERNEPSRGLIFFLAEIAAQLAEMNGALGSIAEILGLRLRQ